MSGERHPLTDSQRAVALASLPEWRVVDGKLHREYKFKDFITAIGFMMSAALIIQEMDHHPEWSNVYGTVRIDLVTHSAGGITEMDLKLATRLEELSLSHRS